MQIFVHFRALPAKHLNAQNSDLIFLRSGSAVDALPKPVLPEFYLILEQANRAKRRFAHRRARVTLSPPFWTRSVWSVGQLGRLGQLDRFKCLEIAVGGIFSWLNRPNGPKEQTRWYFFFRIL
jgi:hypothetical protein